MTEDSLAFGPAVAATAGLQALIASSLDPLFWSPQGPFEPSSWWTHVPFAHWLVVALRPAFIVDIAPPRAVSYKAFCRAVSHAGLETRCHTMPPEASDGLFSMERVDLDGNGSNPLDAEAAMESIDRHGRGLLHIDLSADVPSHAVETWMAKLPGSAIVLLTGIGQRTGDADRRRMWEALAEKRPHFEFPQGRGLGMLAVGDDIPAVVAELCDLTTSEMAERIRGRLAEIGDRWQRAADASEQARNSAMRDVMPNPESEGYRSEIARWRTKALDEERARAQIAFRLTVARGDVYAAGLRVEAVETAAADAEMRAARAEERLAGAEERAALAEERAAFADMMAADAAEETGSARDAQARTLRDRDAILRSRAWIATRSLQRLAERYPAPARLAWRSARLVWWSFSLQLPMRYQDWRRRPGTSAPLPRCHGPDMASAFDIPELLSGSPGVGLNHQVSTWSAGVAALDQSRTSSRESTSEAHPANADDGEAERLHDEVIDLLAFLASERRIAFAPAEDQCLSIVLDLPRDAASVFSCLTSLRGPDFPPFELIALRRPGDPRTAELLSRCDPLRVVDVASDEGQLSAFNRGVALSHGRTLLFLDGTAIVRPGALAAASGALDGGDDIGAVGCRLVRPSGRLGAAGGIVWADAGLGRYGDGLEADASEAMFSREAEFSDLPLLVARSAWDRTGDFDAAFETTDYGLADYGVRLRRNGLRVLYEPAFVADLRSGGNAFGAPVAVEKALRDSRARFRSRHDVTLRLSQLPKAEANLLPAREPRRAGRRRLLMIDNEVPFGSLGSGYPRAREVLAVAADAGWAVTLFPLHRTTLDWTAVRAELPPDVEVIARRGVAGLADFLEERGGFYDVMLVSRPDNMELARKALRKHPDALGGARLVYDAEAVFAYREVIRAELEGRPYTSAEVDDLCLAEAEQASDVDGITCVSDAEAAFFRDRTKVPVYVLNHPVIATPNPPGFAARSGFLFVGRLLEPSAPNWQGLSWFVRTCWPLVRAVLPDATLSVAGHLHPDHEALMAPGVHLLGPVADLAPIYDGARVFVAPVRFAAGVPIKILEATAAGLPVVATRLMASQLGWRSGAEIFADDDPQGLAGACVELHEDVKGWDAMRAAAVARLERDYGPDQFRTSLLAALDGRSPPIHAPGVPDVAP